MKDKERSFSPPTIGGSSLLVIFAVLCLTVFALLSLSTVQSDGRLSDKTLETTVGYYEADSKAEEILSTLRCGFIPDGVTQNGSEYTFSVPITDTQALEVDVTVNGSDYRILRWQTVSTVDWQADESLSVWLGD